MKLSISKPLIHTNKIYYGWVVLFVTALSYFFSAPGQTFFISGFIDIYVNDMGWDRATISTLYSIATLASGFLIFHIGRLADKIGNKTAMLGVGALLGLACLWNSFNRNLVTLFIGFAFSRLLGQGAMTLLPSIVLPQWFVKKRAMAFSFMSVGAVAASSLVPIINASLLKVWDWRDVWRFWGILLWIVFLPLTFLFLFNKPQDIGLEADNKKQSGENSSAEQVEEDYFTPNEAVRTFSFWGMFFCQLILPLITTGITFHLVSIFQSKGMTSYNAAMILSLFSMVSFPVTLIAGRLMDTIKPHIASAAVSVIEIGALVLLLFANSLPLAIAFAILHGTATGLQSVCNGIVWPNYFGTKHLGSIRGIVMTGTVVSSAVGPMPFGLLFAQFGNYNLVLLLAICLPVIGFFVALFSKKPLH